MKQLFRTHIIQRLKSRYRVTLTLFAVVAATVMILTLATAQASALKTPTLTGNVVIGTAMMGSAASGAAIPESASGCNQSVCIAVCNNSSCTGSGLYIDHVISTGVSTSRTGSVVGQMLVRGSVRETTNRVRWINPSGNKIYLYAYYPVGYNINNGSQVCVRWVGTGAPNGLPCETVHS